MTTHSITEALQYITDDQSCTYDASPAFAELDQLTNSHAALYAALEGLADGFEDWNNFKDPDQFRQLMVALKEARTALALARGEKGGEAK